ncbi:uncharacterized protein LOC132746955 [Ruditapes philippinarum]|uniref:uncharacterized protein LOC132746955 n=1 Tax=Ruditapes philippinarum TaxID=129788 RepID=UPI00295B6267|nr:uncharacterized protein LOC132746955 [Ruditapes philippinarum]
MSAKQIAALQEERAKLKLCSGIPTKVNHAQMEDTKSNYFDLCICNRQLQDILCRSCGYIFVGRQRRQCSMHPNEIHLMDSVVCPKCRTDSLLEIKTSKTPVKHDSDEIITELAHLRQRRYSKDENDTRHVSIGTSPEGEQSKNVFHNSFTMSNNRNTGNAEKETHGVQEQHTDEKFQDLRRVKTQLTFDSLKSSESKASETKSTCDTMSSNTLIGFNLMKSDMNNSSGPGSVVDHDRIPLSGQTKVADSCRMPCLKQSSAIDNHRMRFSGQVLGFTNKCMPLSSRLTAIRNIGMPFSMQDTSSGNYRMPQLRQVQASDNSRMPLPGLAQVPGNCRMPLSGQASVPDKSRMPLSGQGIAQMPQCNVQKPEKNLVNTEVQTDFVFQGLQEPKFYHQTDQTPVQPMKESSFGNSYKYEPRKAVGGEKENNILKAAIRRSNTEGWNKGVERMNDLCIGDRRF